MKNFIMLMLLVATSAIGYAQDLHGEKWLQGKEVVKSRAKGVFIEQITKGNYMEELHFIDYDSSTAVHMFYVFRKNQLVGIKTQRLRLSGENTKYNALDDYSYMYNTYLEKYGKEKIKEKTGLEQSVKVLEVKLPDKDLFVTVEKNGNEYFVVENIFKNN